MNRSTLGLVAFVLGVAALGYAATGSPSLAFVRGGLGDAPDGAPAVQGQVQIAAALRAEVRPDDAVFVFARAEGGGASMPLAVQKLRVRDLPYRFSLAADAPAESGNGAIEIVARVSRNGQATPAAGDLEGRSAPTRWGQSDVAVLIDRERR